MALYVLGGGGWGGGWWGGGGIFLNTPPIQLMHASKLEQILTEISSPPLHSCILTKILKLQ